MAPDFEIPGDSFQIALTGEEAAFFTLSQAGDPLLGVAQDLMVGASLDGYSYVCFLAAVVDTDDSANTPRVRIQYSLDNAAWATLTTNTVSLAAAGLFLTDWEDIPALAQDAVLLRPFALGGDGGGDPSVTGVTVFCRR